MIYVYHCDVCDVEIEVIKSVSDIDRVEPCETCQKPMERMIMPAYFGGAKVIEPHFNYGLGINVTKAQDIKERVAYLRGETGKDIVEVGTSPMGHIKKKRKSYDDVYSELGPKY